ncbi:hypothetical protein E2C01_051969 [Portunus trituberculatus]|uniref:Uncharacterized protein n=1 Tax=Portunus trituberculatus TaxID=210409 RepID=A0A5B7GKA4_PORTR|nr:hypothetical protein [Portunus trituberculatus]
MRRAPTSAAPHRPAPPRPTSPRPAPPSPVPTRPDPQSLTLCCSSTLAIIIPITTLHSSPFISYVSEVKNTTRSCKP